MRILGSSLSEAERQKIRALAEAGRSQKQICDELGISRGRCQWYRRRLGLLAKKNGPHCPRIQKKTAAKILTLLREGHSQRQVARTLRIREWAVRRTAERNGFRRPLMEEKLEPELREKIIREIRGRQNHAIDIAHKYGCSYKLILRLAKRELGTIQFYPGRTRVPLWNRLP